MGRSLTTLALLLAIVLTAALLVPALTDWEDQRTSLEAQLTQIIGGPVALAGPVSVRLLPSPRLTAARVSFADGAERLSVEGASLHAELALWPLFANRVVVTRISLAGGEMRVLGNMADIRALADELAGRMSLGAGAFNYIIAPERLILGEGDDALVLENPRADIVWAGKDTPVRLTLRANETLRADGTFRPQTDGSWRVTMRGTYLEDAVVLSINGVLASFHTGAEFIGDFSLTSDDTYRVLGLEGEGTTLSLRGGFHAEGAQWLAEGAKLTLGTMQGVIDVRAETGTQLTLNTHLTSALVDLDGLGFEMVPVRTAIMAAAATGAPMVLPTGLHFGFSINADGVVLGGRVARDIDASFHVRDGAFFISSFSGHLPGGTEVTFLPRRDWARRLVVTSASARSLMSWLDIDTTPFPDDKLQELSLDASISEGPGPLQIEIMSLTLDSGTARGTLAYDQTQALSVEGEFANLDLDAYVPGIKGSFIERARALAEFGGTHDAMQFDLTGEDVRLAGAALSQFRFVASSSEGALEFEQAGMIFASGGHLNAAGQWSSRNRPFDLSLEGVAVDPGFFEGLPLAPTAPADLNLAIAQSDGGLQVSGTVRTSGLEIDIAGQEADGDVFEGRLIARGIEQGALARALGFDVFAAYEGAELLDIQWSGAAEGGELTARVELAGFSALAQGSAMDVLSDHPQADLSVELLMRSAGDLVTHLRGPDLTGQSNVSLSGVGHLRRDETGWRFQSNTLQVGETSVSLDLVLSEDLPLTGRLEIEYLALARPHVSTPEDAESETRTLAWSTVPFDLDWMESASAELDIAIGIFTFGQIPLKDVAFHLSAAADSITIDHGRGAMGGGLLTGSATITREGPALAVTANIAGEGVPTDTLLDAGGLPAMEGDLTMAAHLSARGRSPFDLVAGLDGRLDMGMNEGAFAMIDLGGLEAALPTVRTRLALRDAASEAISGGNTGIVRLAGAVPIARGVLSLSRLEGIAETGAYSIDGSLDLRSQIVDVETVFQISDADFGPSPVVVMFRGVGGELSTSIDITALQETIGPRLADTPQGLLSEEDLPEDLRELLQAYEAAYPEDSATTP